MSSTSGIGDGTGAAAAKSPDPIVEDTSAPKPMSQLTRVLFANYMMVLNVLLVYMLIKIWPEKAGQTAGESVGLFWEFVPYFPLHGGAFPADCSSGRCFGELH